MFIYAKNNMIFIIESFEFNRSHISSFFEYSKHFVMDSKNKASRVWKSPNKQISGAHFELQVARIPFWTEKEWSKFVFELFGIFQ